MCNRCKFQSQYWQQTLWTWIYARQAGSSTVYSGFVKNILYPWSVCQSLMHLEARSPYKYCWFREIQLEGKVRSCWAVCWGKSIKKNIFTWSLEMTGLYEKPILVAAVASLAVLAAVRSSPVVGPEPIRCAPCTQEKLNACPAVPPDCQQVLREPGCGCCMACALETGASCGVHTAHCGEGLRCTPRPGEARPLHALTRGQGVCTEDLGQGSLRASWIPPVRYLVFAGFKILKCQNVTSKQYRK